MGMRSLGALCTGARAKEGTRKRVPLRLPTFLHMDWGGYDASFA